MSEKSGDCQICGSDPGIIVVLPMARGNDKPFGCVSCALNLGLYCVRHRAPHTAFEDGLSACLRCINEESERRAETGEELLRTLEPLLDCDEHEDLEEWLETAVELTGSSEGHCFMRAVVGKAFRLNEPVESIQTRVVAERSIGFIF